jgi:polyketide cyclase/dehydrase/lipid transport protein
MRRAWFSCQAVDQAFLESAPVRLRARFDIRLPAAAVWGELTSDQPLSWCRILREITWTSARPFGVGTRRTVNALWGTNLLREHYFLWEEGRRHSFYLLESTAPLFRSLAEDYLVEPTSEDSCRFTWTIALEPRAAARPATPLNRVLLKTLFTDTARHYGLR